MGSIKRKADTHKNLGSSKRPNASRQTVASIDNSQSARIPKRQTVVGKDSIQTTSREEPISLSSSEDSSVNSGEDEGLSLDNGSSEAEMENSESDSSRSSTAQSIHAATNEYSLDITYPEEPLDKGNNPATVRAGLKRMEYRRDQILRVLDPKILTSLYPQEINLACRIYYDDNWLVVRQAIDLRA